jgi:hypothetical protein
MLFYGKCITIVFIFPEFLQEIFVWDDRNIDVPENHIIIGFLILRGSVAPVLGCE